MPQDVQMPFDGGCAHSDGHHQVVELAVPALAAYLGVLRVAAADLAARLRFGVEDVRTVVDEAGIMLLPLARVPAPAEPRPRSFSPRSSYQRSSYPPFGQRAGADPEPLATLTCRFRFDGESLHVTVWTPVGAGAALPARHHFAWQVLSAHAAEVQGSVADGLAELHAVIQRPGPPLPA